MKHLPYFPLAFGLALSFLISAPAAERVALVVGNDQYKNARKLTNPVNDAKAVAGLLKEMGFEVIRRDNAGIEELYDGLEEFKRKAGGARIGLFYFAGHGIEVEKNNYLIPIDAELERQSQLRSQTVSLKTVLADMKAVRLPAKLIILDCCRDNPLTRSWMSTRSAGAGLAGMDDSSLPEATMIMYAAGPGQTALDGQGKNSPFTEALLNELGKPDRSALEAFYAVSDSVVEKTRERQEPWVKVDGAGRAFRQFNLAARSSTPEKKMPPPPTPKPTPPPSKPATEKSVPKREAGEELVGDSGIILRWCPPGEFTMGDSEWDGASPHTATLSKGFWLGQHEITRGEYRKVMGTNAPDHFPGLGDDSPVDGISWDDAFQFCRRLTERERNAGALPEGFEYALPSEAQWEYACRAGSESPFSFGDDLTLQQANFRHSHSGMLGVHTKDKGKGSDTTAPLVIRVNEGSPAEKAGIEAGDRILEVDNRFLPDTAAFTGYLMQKNGGDTATLKIDRDGKTLEKEVDLEELRSALDRQGYKFIGADRKETDHSRGRPAIAGTFPPNDWGFTEMHGNVGEWCGDWFGDHPEAAKPDPAGATSGRGRVVKGGNWSWLEQQCRSGSRSWIIPRLSANATGFRVALVPAGSFSWGPEKFDTKNRTRIVPDEYETIQSAINDARDGDTVLIKEGIYRELLSLNDWKDIEVRGENKSTTILRGEAINLNLFEVMRVSGGQISNLTLEISGKSEPRAENDVPRSLLLINENSSITVSDCIFRGGGEMFGVLVGDGDPLISNCLFEDCFVGVDATGETSTPTIRDNTIRRSKLSGIIFEWGGGGIAEGNILENNTLNGIGIFNESTNPKLLRNTCSKNRINGISYFKGAGGSAVGNTCESNDGHGISISESSPLIEGNQCNRNKFSGILAASESSKPRIIGNTCNNNEQIGIAVEKICYPAEFENNRASGNKRADIERSARLE